jgi:predicted 2-oxoglutarate/Fe(II)-dependent dioxygenase YbiX
MQLLYTSQSIYVYDNVLTDTQCNEIVRDINNLPLIEKNYCPGNNVLCSLILVHEIENDQKRQKIDDTIYKCVGEVIQNLKNDNEHLICRGDTGYELRKIIGPTKLHVDDTVSGFNDYVHNNRSVENNQIRSVSLIIALNNDYEGGEFCFPEQNIKIKLGKGQAIAFPPYWTHPHYTNDLKNGTCRYTITTWLTQ